MGHKFCCCHRQGRTQSSSFLQAARDKPGARMVTYSLGLQARWFSGGGRGTGDPSRGRGLSRDWEVGFKGLPLAVRQNQ